MHRVDASIGHIHETRQAHRPHTRTAPAPHTGAPPVTDLDVRLAAFEWLHAQVSLYGEVLPRTLLTQGFQFQNHRVPLLDPQGIWKPQVLPQYPLSITTTPKGPYNDSFGSDDSNAFAYRGMYPEHRDTVGLRAALTHPMPPSWPAAPPGPLSHSGATRVQRRRAALEDVVHQPDDIG